MNPNCPLLCIQKRVDAPSRAFLILKKLIDADRTVYALRRLRGSLLPHFFHPSTCAKGTCAKGMPFLSLPHIDTYDL